MSSYRHLNDYLQHTDLREILLLVPQLLHPNTYVEVSHCLFILVRGKRSELAQDDEVSADFKSSHIRDMIWQRQRIIDIKDAIVLYNTYRFTPQTTSLGAWIFEGLAVHITRGSVPFQRHKLAGNFHAMTRSSVSSSRCEILLHDDSGARVTTPPTRQDALFYFSPSSAGSATLSFPISKRELVIFSPEHLTLTDIKIVPTAYYIPSNPLFAFDAFILDKIADEFTLWILYMTKAERQQGANLKGFEVIKELRAMCEKKVGHGTVSLKYVLVTPGPANNDRIVAWRVPAGWQDDEDVQGEVYVQFIGGDELLPTMVF